MLPRSPPSGPRYLLSSLTEVLPLKAHYWTVYQTLLAQKELRAQSFPLPRSQADSKTGQCEVQRLVSLFIQSNLKGPSQLRTDHQGFVVTISQFNCSVSSFLVFSLPAMSMLRWLLNKTATCKVPLQNLCPRKPHVRQRMRGGSGEEWSWEGG